MKRNIDCAMDKCEQLSELIRIIKDGGENTPTLLYDLATEKCNEILLLLKNDNSRDNACANKPEHSDTGTAIELPIQNPALDINIESRLEALESDGEELDLATTPQFETEKFRPDIEQIDIGIHESREISNISSAEGTEAENSEIAGKDRDSSDNKENSDFDELSLGSLDSGIIDFESDNEAPAPDLNIEGTESPADIDNQESLVTAAENTKSKIDHIPTETNVYVTELQNNEIDASISEDGSLTVLNSITADNECKTDTVEIPTDDNPGCNSENEENIHLQNAQTAVEDNSSENKFFVLHESEKQTANDNKIHLSKRGTSEVCIVNKGKIKGIREVLSINDLYLFKRELFNNDTKAMNSLFDILEKATSLDECKKILYEYAGFNTDDGSPAAEFFERLKKRF